MSTDVQTTRDRLLFQCNVGHEWETQLKNVLEGRWCPRCSADRCRHSIDVCHDLAKQKNGKCLSTEYKNTDSKVEWECENGHKWMATPQKVRQGRWCPHCIGHGKDIEHYRNLARSRGGLCLSRQYLGPDKHLRWRCSEGHEWRAQPNNVGFGTWCPYCAGKHQTIEDMRALAESRGGRCLSAVYTSQKTKMRWRCANNHIWQATPNSIKRGSWCPKCHIYYGEEVVRSYFEAAYSQRFPKQRPIWLEGMELDGYSDNARLAFEHHGTQHYKYSRRFHPTRLHFEEQKNRDKRKRHLCESRGIDLVEVPHIPIMLSLDEVPAFLDDALQTLGRKRVMAHVKVDLAQAYDQSSLNELREIAKKKRWRPAI